MWLGRLRRGFNTIRADIERELKTDEIKQDLHNEEVMQSLKQAEQALRGGLELDGNTNKPAGDQASDTTKS